MDSSQFTLQKISEICADVIVWEPDGEEEYDEQWDAEEQPVPHIQSGMITSFAETFPENDPIFIKSYKVGKK